MADILLAGVLLLAAAPVLACIAVAVRLTSPGPVLFRQMRAGLNGQPFSMMKFRTMYVSVPASGSLRQTERGDRRVTPLGRFLRGHSLDELPQLLNVLHGSMSMVGPRPHALTMTMDGCTLDYWVPNYAQRHAVKPGITGLAQVNGRRGNVETLEQLRGRVAFDLDYISRWSIWLDVSIVAATVRCVLNDRHAF